MIALAAVAIALPFLGACASLLLGPRSPQRARLVRLTWPAVVAVAPVAVSTLLTLIVALSAWSNQGVRTGALTVVPMGNVPFAIALYVDGLSAVVAFMVCCVSLAVQVYSASSSSMAADRRYSSYAAFVSLCTAAMLLVVLSGDLIVLYVGWEVMGLCSYLLIGHRRADGAGGERGAAERAAVRAFLVTRVGDVAFLFGIFVLGLGARTFSIRGVLAHDYPHATALAGTLLLVAGVAGKSALFPLHTWLAGTVAGPVPVSALIHAATMSAAGVYVVARLFPAFRQAPATLTVLGVMAAISMLGPALAALAQNDLSRVLAYSTISQIAYVAAGLAVGARAAAVLQLLAHGAVKALLVLGAGCVITAVGSAALRDMGGLRLAMPVTFWSMTIGWAALAGVPVASGFFGTDAIVAAAQHAVFGDGERPVGGAASEVVPPGGTPVWAALVVYLAVLLGLAVTGAYAARAWLMTFFGERRAGVRAREAPPLMRLPVAALAVPALVLGFFGVGSAALRPEPIPTVVMLLMVGAGAGAAFVVWNRDPALDPARVLGRPVRTVLGRAWYADAGYDQALAGPAAAPARLVGSLARLVATVDDRVINAAAAGTGGAVRRLGGVLRRTEGGNPQTYLTGLLAGVAIIALVVVVCT
jgi:NADH-quinone oxidoreductase subunit L